MSSRDRSFGLSGAETGGDAGLGGGCGGGGWKAEDGEEAGFGGKVIWPTARDFSEAETERSSSETLFNVTEISSTLTRSWLSFSFSVLMALPAQPLSTLNA